MLLKGDTVASRWGVQGVEEEVEDEGWRMGGGGILIGGVGRVGLKKR